MEDEAQTNFIADDIDLTEGALACEYLLDMRYEGQSIQSRSRRAGICSAAGISEIADSFHAAHEKALHLSSAEPDTIVTFNLVARVAVAKPDLPRKAVTGKRVEQTILGTRRVDFDGDGLHAAQSMLACCWNPAWSSLDLRSSGADGDASGSAGTASPSTSSGSYHVHIGE